MNQVRRHPQDAPASVGVILLSQSTLKRRLSYDPETGLFTWLSCERQPYRNGKAAGSSNKNRYVSIRVEGKRYYAHRLAWLYVHGDWPDGEIDHINGVRDDNRMSNLRVAKTPAEQQQNCKLQKNNTSGYPGVYWNKANKRWMSRIGANGEDVFLGYFDDVHEAGQAYLNAKAKLHTFNPIPRET